MSDPVIDIDDVTPGARYLWRAYKASGDKLEVGLYRDDEGQLLWDVDPKVVRRAKPRALAVLVAGRQVRVTRVEGLRLQPARLAVRFVPLTLGARGVATPAGVERSGTIDFLHVIERLKAGHEVVDAEALPE